ncbi:MAG: hypothetical protein AAGJ56_04605 [Myxococcota bacterium]
MSARYALVGDPIGHSPSPAMHNAGFRALGIDASYELRPTVPDTFSSVIDALHAGELQGVNVTTPLKGLAAAAFDASALAERARSANTIYRADDSWRCESTDIDGVRHPLQTRGIVGGEALIIGAGGAARAAALALEQLGAIVHVASRRLHTAANLLEEVAPRPRGRSLALENLTRDPHTLERVSVVVQATPVGMHGEELPIPWERFAPNTLAFEMLYRDTPFIKTAIKRGWVTIRGREMMLEQGVRAFELWTGQPAPREAMRDALSTALDTP